jgi:hypothetical protein
MTTRRRRLRSLWWVLAGLLASGFAVASSVVLAGRSDEVGRSVRSDLAPARTSDVMDERTAPAAPVPAEVAPAPEPPPAPAPEVPPAPAPEVPPAPAPEVSPPTEPAAPPESSPSPAELSTTWGCDAAVDYLRIHANPDFEIECPGNAFGHQAMTCAFTAGYCPDRRVIAIAVPCPAAYMNEAENSWIVSGFRPGPIDPFGHC